MSTLDKSQACEILLNVNTQVPPTKMKGDRRKSVLFDACSVSLHPSCTLYLIKIRNGK